MMHFGRKQGEFGREERVSVREKQAFQQSGQTWYVGPSVSWALRERKAPRLLSDAQLVDTLGSCNDINSQQSSRVVDSETISHGRNGGSSW